MAKGLNGKYIWGMGGYKYIHARWVKIVFELFIHQTPGVARAPVDG